MTDKEKDAVWRSLPEACQEKMREVYNDTHRLPKTEYDAGWNDGASSVLIRLFGTHNLAAEEKPKQDQTMTKEELAEYARKNRRRLEKQEVKLGDVVKVLKGHFAGEHGTVKEVQACCGYDPDDLFFSIALGHEVPEKYQMHPNSLAKNVIGGLSNTDFEVIGNRVDEPKTEPKNGEIVIPVKAEYDESIWLPYRMELAKEVTIAMIRSVGRVKDSEVFEIVDGIVERLKGGVNNG